MPQDLKTQQMPVDGKYFEQYQPEDDYFGQFEHEAPIPLAVSHKTDSIPETVNKVADKAKGFLDNQYVRRFLYGPSEEDLGGVKLNPDDADVPIPGMSEGGKYIERKLANTGNYYAGFAGGLIGHAADLLSHPLGFAGPTGVEKAGIKGIESTQKLLPRGQYTVDRVGQIYGGEQIPRQSMRESLGGKDILEGKVIKSEKVPNEDVLGQQEIKPRNASEYINGIRSGEIEKGTSFEDWKSQVPQEMKVGPGHTEADHYLETLPIEERHQILGQFIDKYGADWPTKFAEWFETQKKPSTKFSSLKPGEYKSTFSKIHEELYPGLKNDLPQAAAAENDRIKIGADIGSLGKVLGSSLYQGDFPKIVTKELLQNAFDATRHLGDRARIDVDLNEPGLTKNAAGHLIRDSEGNPLREAGLVRVRDNGNGMTRKELETVFTDLGASGKRNDENAVGGFGLAKAAPLLGGEKVKVTSRVMENGILLEHTFEGTPKDLLSGEGVPISTRKLTAKDIAKESPDEFDSVTGTMVETWYPKDLDTYYARQFVNSIVENSTAFKGKIRVSQGRGLEHNKYLEPKIYQSNIVPGKTIKLGNEHADVDLMIPGNAVYGERPGVMARVLNNGMYQGDIRFGGWDAYPNVPDKIILDVKSKVPEGDINYPFTANREALRGTTEKLLKDYIQQNIIQPGINARMNSIKQAYARMPLINGIHFYDVGNKFTPQEFNAIVQHPQLRAVGEWIQLITDDALKAQSNEAWSNKLERIGIIFDERVKGIHIPNPGVNKSAIMINPMQIMLEKTPNEASAGLLHTILHELAHVEGGGHDEAFAVRLADVYTKYGASNALTAQKEFERLISGGTGKYLPEIENLLLKYTESRGRTATIDDPLYRTGIGSRDFKSKGKGEIPSNPKSSADRPASVTKLLEAIANSKPLREEQEAIYSAERSQRFKNFMGVKEGGKAGAIKQLSKLKGEMERVQGIELSDVDVDQLFNLVKSSPRITPGEKAKGYTALFKLLEGGDVPQRGELNVLDRVFGAGFGQQIIELHGGIGAVNVKLAKTANTMKTLMASLDLSAPFRQGIGLVTRKEFYSAFASMFKYAGSEKAFQALEKSIEAHPNYLLSRDAGLFIADHGLGNYEEAFMNSYVGDLQESGRLGRIVTSPIRASERAYVGFLNKLRFDTFNNMINKLEKLGYKTDQVAGPVAKYINVSTGRGELGRASKYADALNTVLFSPRLISSRLTILYPKYYVDAPDYLRKDAIRTLLGIGGFVAMADQIGQTLGGQLEGHSLSSDFGKIKFGNTRLDPGGGFLQYIVLASRLVQNKTESSSGKTYNFEKNEFNAPNRWSLLFGDKNAPGFIENKFSPMASFISGMLRGRDFAGKPFNTSKELQDRMTPILIQDIRDIYNSDPSLLPLGFPALFGAGVQTYSDRPNKARGLRMNTGMSLRP